MIKLELESRRTHRFAAALPLFFPAVLALILPTPAAASTWDIGVIESAGDVGRFCDLVVDPGGTLHAIYCRTDVPSVRVASRVGSVWGPPEIVDDASDVGGHCALHVAGPTERRIAYYRSGTGSLWFGGPERANTWSVDALESAHDIGTYVSVHRRLTGEVTASCLDGTDGSLLLLTRDGVGDWSVSDVVDTGPGRGANSDHTYRPGAGYVFTEYDETTGMLMYADPVLRAHTWAGGSIEDPEDVGQEPALAWGEDGSLSASCRNATDGSLLLLHRDGVGDWSVQHVVDAGPGRGTNSDLVHRPGVGFAFVEYDEGNGMLLYADLALRSHTWTVGIAEDTDDVGREPALARNTGGALYASCRNETDGSLLLLSRSGEGVWSVAYVVDAGPGRGAHSDLTYRPGAGFAFVEYDEDNGMLMYADPVLRSHDWGSGMVARDVDSGRYVSLVRAPDDALAVTFYRYDPISLGTVCAGMRPVGGTWGVIVVADSVGSSASGPVHTDLAMTEECSWQISFKKTTDPDPGLYLATADSLCIIDVGPGEEPAAEEVLLYALHGNVPNPFNPRTTFRFELPERARVVLEVFDVTGRLVWRHADDAPRSPGRYGISWDGRDGQGQALASGVYLYRIRMGTFTQSNRLVLLK